MAMTSSYFDSPVSPLSDDETVSQRIGKIMSPTSAAELVGPPPDSPPPHQPGQSTPLTGSLAYAPKEAVAKNRDTAMGQTSYNTGVSHPPDDGNVRSIDGGNVRSIVSPQSVQAAQGIRPAQPSLQARPSLVNPLASGVMPALPQSAPQQVQPDKLNMQTQNDQNRLNYLKTSGSGIDQIQNSGVRRVARVGDAALSAILPGIAPLIGGTTARNQMLIGRQQGIVGNDQAQQTQRAALEDTQSQAAERTALGHKADALAQSDAPITLTAEQAAAVDHPELAGMPMAPRTFSAMQVAKTRAGAQVTTGAGHDAARVTVGQGNNDTAVQVGAAHDAARVATSKYGPGNKGAGAGTGASGPAAEPGDMSGVPENMRGLVQAIGEGREGPAPLGRKDGKEIMRLVSQVYPDYDASQFHNYQATRAEFSKGKTGQAINSFNTALTHLGRMENNLPKNTGLPAANWLMNTAKDLSGSAANTPFETDRLAVASEIGKAYKGGVLSKEEHDQYMDLLSRDASPKQQHANINELKGLLGGKLNSFDQQYRTGLPTGATRDFRVISPEAQSVLDRGSNHAASGPSSGKAVSLSDARGLGQNKGKSDAEITKDIEAHGHKVIP